MTVRKQWEGEVEVVRGGGGLLRVGGDDLDLAELLEPGTIVRVTIEWPDKHTEMHRIRTPSFGTLPPRLGSTEKDDEPDAQEIESIQAEFDH